MDGEQEEGKALPAPPLKLGGLEGYVEEVQKVRFIPENEFEHADSLIRSEMDEDSEVMSNFSKIVDRHLQLTNIGNDEIMRYYQTDADLLTHAFSISLRSEAFTQVAKVMFFGWRNQLLLTKAKDGGERKMQGAVGTKYIPKDTLAGYGSSYPLPQAEEEGNLLARLFQRKKNKQGLV